MAGFTASAMSAGPVTEEDVRSPKASSRAEVAFWSSATLAHSTTSGGRARGCWKSMANADPEECRAFRPHAGVCAAVAGAA